MKAGILRGKPSIEPREILKTFIFARETNIEHPEILKTFILRGKPSIEPREILITFNMNSRDTVIVINCVID